MRVNSSCGPQKRAQIKGSGRALGLWIIWICVRHWVLVCWAVAEQSLNLILVINTPAFHRQQISFNEDSSNTHTEILTSEYNWNNLDTRLTNTAYRDPEAGLNQFSLVSNYFLFAVTHVQQVTSYVTKLQQTQNFLFLF